MADVDIDLDQLRAARLEAQQVPRLIRFAGEEFKLPPELPLRAIIAINVEDDLLGFGEVMFGDDWQRFLARDPSRQDLIALAREVDAAYSVKPGEAEASGGSSPKSGKRSRRTSGGSTASTSAKPSGETSESESGDS